MNRICCCLTVFVLAASIGAANLSAGELLPATTTVSKAIDHYVDARLRARKLQPAPQASDAALLRRTMLDLAGRIPATIEARDYLASKDPHKRRELVERLLLSPEYAERQAVAFDTFITRGNGSIRSYLQRAFRENRSWDRIFRDVLAADVNDKNSRDAANFLISRAKDADQLTNDVSVAFFGVNVSCAKCHDHPLVDDWKQDHFFGMKSFFNRTFASGKFVGERSYGKVSFKTRSGESRDAKLMFLTGTVVKEPKGKELSAKERRELEKTIKRLIKQKKAPPAPKFSRRQQLVEIALKPGENRFFVRNIVNRVWHQYLGYGLVTPLDQMHSGNPPSHPELLDWLARDFASHGYDLRRLVRGILLSRTYSRSSRWREDERPERSLFAVAEVRPLTPTQLARSLSLAAADPESFDAAKLKPAERTDRIAKTAGTRFLDKFEQPGDNFQVSADEALFFTNSPEMQKTYLNGGLISRLERIKDPAKTVETAVWAVLSRPPTNDEAKLLLDYLQSRSDHPRQARQQIVWSLMTGSEFRFNH